MFADRAKIVVISGKGGDGHISFRREKYVANGGPDGGDGGDGGSVFLEVDEGLNTLTDFRHVRKYKAKDGEEGGKRNCHGKSGEDVVLKVPEGTVVKEAASGRVIVDMSGETRRFCILKGGKGGLGNQHFATSAMQAPKYAKPGQPARELELFLELKVIADVGLVGFPNVGKSTLLSRVSGARPKIANYHFTTLQPNLGVVDLDGADGFVVADIPGLIEGASKGVGLGFAFLRHIERTRVMLHVLDAAGTEGRDPIEDYYAIRTELEKYERQIAEAAVQNGRGSEEGTTEGYFEALTKRPQLIAANKMDVCVNPEETLKRLNEEFAPQGIEVFPISAVTGEGVSSLLYRVSEILTALPKKRRVFAQEFDPETDMRYADEPYTVSFDETAGEYVLEGPRMEKMLGYTNLESEKGFAFFQKFLRENGMLDELEARGIRDGDTVRIYGFSFIYYK